MSEKWRVVTLGGKKYTVPNDTEAETLFSPNDRIALSKGKKQLFMNGKRVDPGVLIENDCELEIKDS